MSRLSIGASPFLTQGPMVAPHVSESFEARECEGGTLTLLISRSLTLPLPGSVTASPRRALHHVELKCSSAQTCSLHRHNFISSVFSIFGQRALSPALGPHACSGVPPPLSTTPSPGPWSEEGHCPGAPPCSHLEPLFQHHLH